VKEYIIEYVIEALLRNYHRWNRRITNRLKIENQVQFVSPAPVF